MAATTASHAARRTRWRRFYLARGVTVLWIAVAALASCQRFREGVRNTRDFRHAEFAAHDACVEGGGAWLADAGTCQHAARAKEPPAGEQ